jgi:ABC-type lipoprotein export system ATPase subunit
MIEVNEISKIYRKGSEVFTALDNVSVVFQKGEFIAVSGPSGAGKSTLLNTIGGLIQPDNGFVKFRGNDIYLQKRSKTDEYRKRYVGFMFQQFHLMPYLTVLENIKLACYQKSHLESIDSYLAGCSLTAMKNKYPDELSVGEKQRAAFIRAIIANPELLLADEPTGNLDPENSKMLMQLIAGFHKKGATVIMVSHDPLNAQYADRSLVLKNGKLV